MGTIDDLLAAIRAGDEGRVAALLAAAPGLAEAATPGGERPLLAAIYTGAGSVVALLLERGARPTFFEAAALGDRARARALLAAEPALLAERSPDGWTALHLAAHFGHLALARWLLDEGAAVNARSSNALANLPLHAALAGNHGAVAALLIEHGAEVNDRQRGGGTPLHTAAANGSLEAVRLLLVHGANAGARLDDGQTPLGLAQAQGHAAVAALLRQAAA